MILKLSLGLVMAGTLLSCGADDEDGNTSTSASTVAFSDVSSIIVKGCDGAACHGSASSNVKYVGSEELVKANAAAIKTRLETTSTALKMPQTGSSNATTFSATDRQMLIDYVAEHI